MLKDKGMIDKSSCKKVDLILTDQKIEIPSSNLNILDRRIIIHGENLPVIKHDLIIDLIGYTDDGIIQMEGRVALSIGEQLNVDIIKADGVKDRRACLKVKSDIDATILSAYMPNSSKKTFHISDVIRLRNISAGGISFYSNKIYFKRQQLYIYLHEISESLKLKSIVLRKNRERYTSNYKYRYACKFNEVNLSSERKLYEYIFKTELENYRREQEKDTNIHD